MYFPTNTFVQQMYVKCKQCDEKKESENINALVLLDFYAQLIHLKNVHGVKLIDLDSLEFIYEN